MVALVPVLRLEGRCLWLVLPDRILIDVIRPVITGLGQQGDLLLVRGLHQRHKGAWLVEVVGGAFAARVVGAFKRQVVAVPAIDAALAAVALIEVQALLAVPQRAGLRAVLVLGGRLLVEASGCPGIGAAGCPSAG